ncbi:MAG TPA: hypothetical protein VF746_16105 [Longimicrobium sp.]|jgi:NO-binding membrane sensor protein with MHYT domain
MPSPDRAAGAETREERTVLPLLDTVFGFFVWAVHLLAVYAPTAVACQLGLGGADAATRTAFQAGLVGVTVIAAALVVLHALRRYRRQRAVPERRFRMALTLGTGAVAAVAIVWQLFAVLLLPLCR